MASKTFVKIAAALISLTAIAGGATVWAQGGPEGFHGHRGGFGVMAGMQQLGLSPDQQQQIKTAMQSHRDEFKALGDRVRQARQAEQAAVEQVPMNEGQIRAASAALAAAEADMAVLRARVHEQVFSVLTPDQQTRAKQLQADRAARRAAKEAEWRARRQQQAQPQPQQQ
jgi:Spy/CpxP family protein refolding chaperone